MKILIIGLNSSSNSIGRVHVLWRLIRHLGGEALIMTSSYGELWKPLASNDEFASSFRSFAQLRGIKFSTVIAQKALPETVRLGKEMAFRSRCPLVVDIDDPDFEAVFGYSTRDHLKKVAKRPVSAPNLVRYYMAKRFSIKCTLILSNPVLSLWYGDGTVVPHAREAFPQMVDRRYSDAALTVAFVGTPRQHKGLAILRDACTVLDYRLIVTGAAPHDCRPNEQWIGQTDYDAGRKVLEESDIVSIPSQDAWMSHGQLPMKLLDAMAAGRAIVASGFPPISWALDGAGLLVRPGSLTSLIEALSTLKSSELRQNLGEKAEARFRDTFSIEKVAPALGTILH